MAASKSPVDLSREVFVLSEGLASAKVHATTLDCLVTGLVTMFEQGTPVDMDSSDLSGVECLASRLRQRIVRMDRRAERLWEAYRKPMPPGRPVSKRAGK